MKSNKSNIEEYNIFGLNASQKLTNEVCEILKVNQHIAEVTRFADGEILVKAKNSVRKKECFVIQSTSKPVNENLMELLIALDAFKRASAEKINVIIPYFGYARQDRKPEGRQPITAKLVADLIERAGASRVTFFDIHSQQTSGFFNIPIDNISSSLIIAEKVLELIIKNKYKSDDCVLISPDHGGLSRVHVLNTKLHGLIKEIAVIAKRRPEPNKSVVEYILGNVKNKVCFILDDMIDTAGTIVSAAEALKREGAREIYIFATHGLFNGDAASKLEDLYKNKIISGIYVSNSVELENHKSFEGLNYFSLGALLSEVIIATLKGNSLGKIYDDHLVKIKKIIEKNF